MLMIKKKINTLIKHQFSKLPEIPNKDYFATSITFSFDI